MSWARSLSSASTQMRDKLRTPVTAVDVTKVGDDGPDTEAEEAKPAQVAAVTPAKTVIRPALAARLPEQAAASVPLTPSTGAQAAQDAKKVKAEETDAKPEADEITEADTIHQKLEEMPSEAGETKTTSSKTEPNGASLAEEATAEAESEEQMPVAEERPGSQSPTVREDLLERFYSYQKDRRELRRRNLHAQTNIAQFLRKHKITLFPPQPERSQQSVREEYTAHLRKLETLAREREQEELMFDQQMDDIMEKQRVLQIEISRIQNDINSMKFNVAKKSVHVTTGRTLAQKDISDNIRSLEKLETEIQPLRMEHAKLRKRLKEAQELWKAASNDQNTGIDSVEICLENKIISDMVSQRVDELSVYEKKQKADMVASAHVGMKLSQQLEANAELEFQAKHVEEQLEELKASEKQLKQSLWALSRQNQELRQQIGLMADPRLVQDYFSLAMKLGIRIGGASHNKSQV